MTQECRIAKPVSCEYVTDEERALSLDAEFYDNGFVYCLDEADTVVRPAFLEDAPPAVKRPVCEAHARTVVNHGPGDWVYDDAHPGEIRPFEDLLTKISSELE